MKLPTLYKRTSTGAIEQWTIWVEADVDSGVNTPYNIVTEYGHVGGKLQQAVETVMEGKNLGKKNETTTRDQAMSQAKSEHTVKLTRKGYTTDISKAEAGENEGAGGIRPMLAKDFEDGEKKLSYPCYAQPKLDGIRCIAVVGNDRSVSLWSREQKPIVAVPRIARYVESLKLQPGTVLDGELYNHDLKDDFETISSCVRKQYEASVEEQLLIQYHIYDLPRHPGLPDKATFGDRYVNLALILPNDSAVLKLVVTALVKNREGLIEFRTKCQDAGYEGAMARNVAPYEEGKRSWGLLKLKEFKEGDYAIIGVREGVGKMKGCAIFECLAENGNPFSVKLEGALENLRGYLADHTTWQNKKLTVKYFTLTRKNQVPRFPVGKTVRDYE